MKHPKGILAHGALSVPALCLFQDNTLGSSAMSSSGRMLIPYRSVALLHTGGAHNTTPECGDRSIGKGKCGDSTVARAEQSGCRDHTPPAEVVSCCADGSATICASWPAFRIS